MCENFSIKNYRGKIKTTFLVFTSVLAFGGAARAQNINDDLKPKTSAKPKVESKAEARVKPKAKPKVFVKPAKKIVGKTAPGASKANLATVKPAAKPVRLAAVTPPAPPVVVVPAETSDQIITRYMNFQQSAKVTDLDWQSVVAQTSKTLQENPNHSNAKAQSLLAQGQMAYNQRNFPAAISFYKSALQILPTSSLLHYSLGKVYLANGQAKAAETSFKKAIDENKEFSLAYKALGDALTVQGDEKKALKYFKKATETSVKQNPMR